MMSRLIIGIPGIAVILLAVAVGGPVFALFALAVGIGALFEFYSLTAAFMPLRKAGYATAVAAVALCLWVTPSERALILALALGLLFAALTALSLPNREEVTLRVGMTLMGGVYISFAVGVLVLTRELPDGAGAIVNLLVGVWMFDPSRRFPTTSTGWRSRCSSSGGTSPSSRQARDGMTATASISTLAFAGRSRTPTVARAGGASLNAMA